jgi:Ice-binding-like
MRNAFRRCTARFLVMVPVAAFLCSPSIASAASILASAQNFAVLGSTTVTNTGLTSINGNLGLSPGVLISGLITVSLSGTLDQTDPAAQQAQMDAMNAYNALTLLPFTNNLTNDDLGTLGTLTPGVYRFSSSAQLTGTLTLDAQNDPNALFVFEIGSTLTTATNSAVTVINGGANTRVYWLVGSSATLGTATAFEGNILAQQSITLNTSVAIPCGRAIALNGAVTLDTNTVSNTCGGDFGSFGFSGQDIPGAPEPGTVPLVCTGLLILALYGRQTRRRVA